MSTKAMMLDQFFRNQVRASSRIELVTYLTEGLVARSIEVLVFVCFPMEVSLGLAA